MVLTYVVFVLDPVGIDSSGPRAELVFDAGAVDANRLEWETEGLEGLGYCWCRRRDSVKRVSLGVALSVWCYLVQI